MREEEEDEEEGGPCCQRGAVPDSQTGVTLGQPFEALILWVLALSFVAGKGCAAWCA